MSLRSCFSSSDFLLAHISLYKLWIKERELKERKKTVSTLLRFMYGKRSAFQRPSVFSAPTSFGRLRQRNKFSNKSIQLSSFFHSFNTGPLRVARQKEQHSCGRTRGSLLIAIQHVSRGGGGAFVSQRDRAPRLQPFLIYRLFIRRSELQRTFTSSQERRLSNPPGHLPSGCCAPWSVAFFAQPASSFSGRVTGEAQKKKFVEEKVRTGRKCQALEIQRDLKYGRDIWYFIV